MQRVLVLGSPGAGKSTIARLLADRLEIPAIHLDSHFWQKNWIPTQAELWREKVLELLQNDRWVLDGNYLTTLPLCVEDADTAIFLDRRRVVCIWRCFCRFLHYRGSNRPDLAVGCNEKFDWEFFQWIWNYPRNVKPLVLELLKASADTEVIRLKSDRETATFLARVNVT